MESQFRSRDFTGAPHTMPSPSNAPWNVNNMSLPWVGSTPRPDLVEFNGNAPPFFELNTEKSLAVTKGHGHPKRKAEIEAIVPPKQLITEEKMAETLYGLHISTNYTAHKICPAMNSTDSVASTSFYDISMESGNDYNIPMTQKDLEEKLNNCKIIKICDEIKRLNREDSVIPKALMARIEKPCTALVLWQPPSIDKLIVPRNKNDAFNVNLPEDDEEEFCDNNNSLGSVDLNNDIMDLDG